MSCWHTQNQISSSWKNMAHCPEGQFCISNNTPGTFPKSLCGQGLYAFHHPLCGLTQSQGCQPRRNEQSLFFCPWTAQLCSANIHIILWSFDIIFLKNLVIVLLLCISSDRLVCVLTRTCVLFISSPTLSQCAVEHFAGNKLWEVQHN